MTASCSGTSAFLQPESLLLQYTRGIEWVHLQFVAMIPVPLLVPIPGFGTSFRIGRLILPWFSGFKLPVLNFLTNLFQIPVIEPVPVPLTSTGTSKRVTGWIKKIVSFCSTGTGTGTCIRYPSTVTRITLHFAIKLVVIFFLVGDSRRMGRFRPR
jgi:hypothetical protein